MTHQCWPRYVNSAVMLACSIVVVQGIVVLGWMIGQSHRVYVPAMGFCVDLLGPFGNGCYVR